MKKVIVQSPNGTVYKLDELFTVEKLMEVFGVTRVTVYNWLGKKEGNFYPNGRFPNAFKMGKIYIPITDMTNNIGNNVTVK